MGAAAREPGAAMLGEDHHDDPRILVRRERGEPGVVAELEGQGLGVGRGSACAMTCTRAGLAGDLGPRHPRRAVGRAAGLVDHRPEPLAHDSQGVLVEQRRCVAAPAESAPAHQVRRHACARRWPRWRSSPPSAAASSAPVPGRSTPRWSRPGTRASCARLLAPRRVRHQPAPSRPRGRCRWAAPIPNRRE